jgi:hypothetical protein
MTQFKQYLSQVESHCEALTGKTVKHNRKAIKDLTRNLTLALFESGKTVDEYLNAYTADNIIDPSFVFENGITWQGYVKQDWLDFCTVMFELRPVGLGTPNAMVGEAEFMLVFGSPRVGISKVKNTGDVVVDGKTVELKGSEMRIMGNVKGKEVQVHAKKIAEKYNFAPNDCNRNRTAFEPWSKEEHWQQQFANAGKEQSKNFLQEVCSFFMSCDADDFEVCFDNNIFSADALLKVMVKGLWANTTKLWDSYTVIDGSKVSSLSTGNNQFDKLVNEGIIKVCGNYFRSFQDTNIGLYVTIEK